MPQQIKKIFNKIIWWLGVIMVALVLGFCLQFAIAAPWTGPTSPPPNDNVDAPLNIGPNLQIKSGSLNILGSGSDHGIRASGGNYGIWASGGNYGVGGANLTSGTWATLGQGSWGVVSSGPIYMDAWDSQLFQGYGGGKRSIGGAQGWDANKLYINGWGDWSSGVSVGGGAPSNLSVFGKLSVSRDGWGECCSNGDYTLSLSEKTSETGKRAGIQFHNGDEMEGQLRLQPGPNGREFLAYSYQTDMDLRASGIVRGDQGVQGPNFTDANDPRFLIDPNGISRMVSAAIDYIDNLGGITTNAFKMPTGAGSGKVLTSDANGFASWQAQAAGGGGGCYVDYSLPAGKAIGDDCGAGFKVKKSAGTWGYCAFDPSHSFGVAFRPPGGQCPGSIYENYTAYVCCQ